MAAALIPVSAALRKKFRIRSFSGPYFTTVGLNTGIYSVNLRIQSECVKMGNRKTPNTATFSTVLVMHNSWLIYCRVFFPKANSF